MSADILLKQVSQLVAGLHDIKDERPEWAKKHVEGGPDICLYYRFLYELTKTISARSGVTCVETGTRLGCSAAQMAVANPAGIVISVDIDPECSKRVAALSVANIVAITGDSIAAFAEVEKRCKAIDLLYLDSDHVFARVLAEYAVYGSIVRDGGFVLCDDIHMNSDMERFWNAVREPKSEFNHLHTGFGFGVVVKGGM